MAISALDRRSVIKAAGAGALAAISAPMRRVHAEMPAKAGGHIKQSVCRWCYNEIPLEKLAAEAKRIGYQSVELLTPEEFKKVQAAGLTCAVLSGGCPIPDGFNRKENHERLVKKRARAHRVRGRQQFAERDLLFGQPARACRTRRGWRTARRGSSRSSAWRRRRRSRSAWSCSTAR